MKEELVNKLQATYKHVFVAKTYPAVGDGWYFLVDSLCSVLDNYIDSLPEDMQEQFHVSQIKSKYGSLRFDMNHATEFMSGAITMVEAQSETTCETCGMFGICRTING